MTTARLRSLFAAEGVALGVLMPFLVPILVERGAEPAGMGLALGAAGLAALLAYPVWGAIADGWLGRRRTIALSSFTASLGGLLILVSGSDPLTITLALSVAMVGALAWGPLIDALSLQELVEPTSGYGRVRAWASIGWAVAAIIAGAAWVAFGPAPVIAAFSMAALVVAALVLLPATPAGHDESGRDAGGPDGGTTIAHRSWRAWPKVFMTPVLLGFMLGLFVTSVGEHASWRFISLRILDQGGGVFLVGLAAALPAIVEIPVFGASRSLVSRMGLRMLFTLGAFVAAVLMALVAVAPEAWMVTALRTLDGTGYAMRYTAMVIIVGALLPRHLHAVGQSMAWLVYAGVAPIVADALGGLIYERFGAETLFAAATMTLLAGGSIAWLALRGRRFDRGASGRAVTAEVGLATPPPPG